MSMSVGSSSSALSYIQSLLQSLANTAGNVAGVGPLGDMLASASTDGAAGTNAQSSASTGSFGPAPPPFQNGTMAALIALQGQNTNGAGGAQSLFSSLDSDGDGKISQTELETALGKANVSSASADQLFARLDRNGDGSRRVDRLEGAQVLAKRDGAGVRPQAAMRSAACGGSEVPAARSRDEAAHKWPCNCRGRTAPCPIVRRASG